VSSGCNSFYVAVWFHVKQVKRSLVQALRLFTDCTASSGSRGIALHFLEHGTISGWVARFTQRPVLTHGNGSVPIAQKAGRDPRPVSTGSENLAPTEFDSRTVHHVAQSLYRLRYPAHKQLQVCTYCNSSLYRSLVPSPGKKSLAQFCKNS
jgi:hypothetical protein